MNASKEKRTMQQIARQSSSGMILGVLVALCLAPVFLTGQTAEDSELARTASRYELLWSALTRMSTMPPAEVQDPVYVEASPAAPAGMTPEFARTVTSYELLWSALERISTMPPAATADAVFAEIFYPPAQPWISSEKPLTANDSELPWFALTQMETMPAAKTEGPIESAAIPAYIPISPPLERVGRGSFGDSFFKSTLALNLALNLADYFSTRSVLSKPGAGEANPFMKGIVKSPLLFAGVKLGASALSILLLDQLYKKNKTQAWIMTAITNGVLGFVVANNMRVNAAHR
jgi:hypothetical protein